MGSLRCPVEVVVRVLECPPVVQDTCQWVVAVTGLLHR